MLRVVGLPRSDWALIVAAASLLTLAYPPFTLIAPALVCLVPAALLILQGTQDLSPWRRHLRQGFWYGTLTHGALLYWLAMALWAYRPSAVGLYLVAAVALGGATAAMFVAVGQIAGRSRGLLILAMPSGVVALEWLAGQLGPLGFPWHQLALTVSAVPVLVQAADLGGSAELGFIFATVNVSIALAWWMRRRPSVALAHAEVAAMILFFVLAYGLYRLGNVRLEPGATVAVIQPNVGVDEKWQLLRRDEVVERAIRLSQSATGVSGIVDALGRVVTRHDLQGLAPERSPGLVLVLVVGRAMAKEHATMQHRSDVEIARAAPRRARRGRDRTTRSWTAAPSDAGGTS